jgi:hypothetical protein
MGQDVLDRQAKANERAWEMKKLDAQQKFEASLAEQGREHDRLQKAADRQHDRALTASRLRSQELMGRERDAAALARQDSENTARADQARLDRELKVTLAKTAAEAKRAADEIKAEATKLKNVSDIMLKIEERSGEYRKALIGNFGGVATPAIEQQVAEFESELRNSLAPLIARMLETGSSSASEGIVQPRGPWESTHMLGQGVGNSSGLGFAPANPTSAAPSRPANTLDPLGIRTR